MFTTRRVKKVRRLVNLDSIPVHFRSLPRVFLVLYIEWTAGGS